MEGQRKNKERESWGRRNSERVVRREGGRGKPYK